MPPLDDLIEQCRVETQAESVKTIEPDPLCLVVSLPRQSVTREQEIHIRDHVRNLFREAGHEPPPIIVIPQTIEITAIPKSMLKE